MFYKYRNVNYKSGFDKDLYTEYLTFGVKVFSDLPATSFIIQDYTVYCDGNKVGLLRLTRPKKLRLFDTLNWMLCQVWISPKNQNQGIGISIIQKVIKSKTRLEYMIFSIEKTKPGLQQFLSKLNVYKIKNNSTIYTRLDINPRYYNLYYLDLRKVRMTESIEKITEENIIYQTEDLLIAKYNKNKESDIIIKYHKPRIALLPFKQTKNGTYILIECSKFSIESEDYNYNCITKPLDNNESEFLGIQKTMYNIGYKIHHEKPIIPQGNVLLDNNIINNTNGFLINMDKDSCQQIKNNIDEKYKWKPLRKVLNKTIHALTLTLCLKLLQYLSIKDKENKLPEKVELENMSVSSLVSFENPDKSKKVLKTPYPEDLELEEDSYSIF